MSANTNKNTNSPKNAKSQPKLFDFAFERINYILMISGLLILALGYILMVGGGSNDFNEFNESLFDFRRLVLAPLVILTGFAVEIAAIMKRPKK